MTLPVEDQGEAIFEVTVMDRLRRPDGRERLNRRSRTRAIWHTLSYLVTRLLHALPFALAGVDSGRKRDDGPPPMASRCRWDRATKNTGNMIVPAVLFQHCRVVPRHNDYDTRRSSLEMFGDGHIEHSMTFDAVRFEDP